MLEEKTSKKVKFAEKVQAKRIIENENGGTDIGDKTYQTWVLDGKDTRSKVGLDRKLRVGDTGRKQHILWRY